MCVGIAGKRRASAAIPRFVEENRASIRAVDTSVVPINRHRVQKIQR